MITNERQFRVTKAQVDRFREALHSFSEIDLAEQGVDPVLIAAQRSALAGQLGELEAEVIHYQKLQSGEVRRLPLATISDMGVRLIEARIVQGLSQKELGDRLGMKEQQIQRYEQECYLTANLTRCAEVAEALGIDIRAHLEVGPLGPVGAASASAAPGRSPPRRRSLDPVGKAGIR